MSPSQQIAIKSDDLFGLWETVIGDGNCEGQNAIGASAKVTPLHTAPMTTEGFTASAIVLKAATPSAARQ